MWKERPAGHFIVTDDLINWYVAPLLLEKGNTTLKLMVKSYLIDLVGQVQQWKSKFYKKTYFPQVQWTKIYW